MFKKIIKFSFIILISAVLVSGCTFPWQKKNSATSVEVKKEKTKEISPDVAPVKTRQLMKFSDYQGLEKFLEEKSAKQGSTSGIVREVINRVETTEDFSPINIQVPGLDEADIVKFSGNYVYALLRDELKIIKINPASEAEVISTITFESQPQNIFISGNNLVVFEFTDQAKVSVKVFDLANPINPTLVRELDFEGSYREARLNGDYVYLFTDSFIDYKKGKTLIPQATSQGLTLPNDCSVASDCFAPEVFYFDIPYNSFHYFNIVAINISDKTEPISGQSYLINDEQAIYIAQKNVYLTYTEAIDEYDLEQSVKRELILADLSTEEQNKITEIEAVADYILNTAEKKVKVAALMDNYLANLGTEEAKAIQLKISEKMKGKLMARSADTGKTTIYKIALNGKNFEYRGFAEVNGQVLNELSMNEEDGYFRIATAQSSVGARLAETQSEPYSNIFVLDNELKVVGCLENLVTNEKIYAARFLGNRAYLITTKQSDPLYIISLDDPTKPTVSGALRIPDASTYFYPIDQNGYKLIGIGYNMQDDDSGLIKAKGLKISLFDFTDLAKPKELNSAIFGDVGSDSIIFKDHKSFLYSGGKNLLSLPIMLKENKQTVFSGSLIFNIIDNKFVLREKIGHISPAAKLSSSLNHDYSDSTVKRSFYINDYLFTFSNKFLKINSLLDLSLVKSLALIEDEGDYIMAPVTENLPEDSPGAILEPTTETLEQGLKEAVIETPGDNLIDTPAEPVAGTSTEVLGEAPAETVEESLIESPSH